MKYQILQMNVHLINSLLVNVAHAVRKTVSSLRYKNNTGYTAGTWHTIERGTLKIEF
jgi:hypothetical protein